MIRPAIVGVCAASALIVLVATPTAADPTNKPSESESHTVTTDDSADLLQAGIQQREQVLGPGNRRIRVPKWRSLTDAEKAENGYGLGIGEAVCYRPYARIADPSDVRFMFGPGCEDARGGPSTSVLVSRAFRTLVIPKSRIVIQPPGGVTLVNLETLFRTEAEPYEESLRLLGHDVTLRISPVRFVWVTGDGESFSTTSPGIPYRKGVPMSDYVSYKYVKTAKKLRPSVNVVWAATYSVDGGPSQEVEGTVTTTGPATSLRVREAVPVLTG